ncbi:hypothetical protein JCM8115_006731 [Rhodotorula mucilaginosa]
MISYPVMAARFEAVATAGPEPISPTSKAVLSPITGRQSKGGGASESDKKIRPRPAPIKTGVGSAGGGGFFSPLRQKFSALGGKDKSVHEDLSPTRQAGLEQPTVHSASTWRSLSNPPSRSPPMDYGEIPPHVGKPCPPAAAHRRAVSDSPDLFSQARWKPSARLEPVDPASNRPASQTSSESAEKLFLSASTTNNGTGTEHHFGQVPLTVDGGATLRLRSSRRPDELEIGWTCVPGIDALGVPYTTWEISLRPRRTCTGAPPRPISVVSKAETARPRRESSSQSFQSYSMIPTPTLPVQDSHAGGTPFRGFDSRAAVSPTRHRPRPRNASSAYESSSYGSISSDASLWAENSSRQGKMSVSSAATSDPEDCYSPIDLTAYGVTPDSTSPASFDATQRFGRSSSYAPGMAPFTRPRQFSVDPEAANKNRSFSLTHCGSASRGSAISHVEGYGEELRMPDHAAPGGALDRRLSRSANTSGRAVHPAAVEEGKPPCSSWVQRGDANTVVGGFGAPGPALPIERNPPLSSSAKSHLPSPLSQRRQSHFDPSSIASHPPTDSSTFSGPPLCPLPELPPSIVGGKPSSESRFSIASSLDDSEAIDVQTASIHLVEQRPRGVVVSSRWSDHDED